jgi:UDPglucose--hexose-1-phosphate uridylyltransferase
LPELRKDPVTENWVILSPNRTKRPTDLAKTQNVPLRSDNCPFCPGSEDETLAETFAFRNGGAPNQPGWTTRVFPNRFPALQLAEVAETPVSNGLYEHRNGFGAHEVIVDCPEHVVSMGDTAAENIGNVFLAFQQRIKAFKQDPRLAYTILFKNHGEPAGASLQHSHSQLMSLPMIPERVREELEGSERYFQHSGRCVFCDILEHELAERNRLIFEDQHIAVIAPYAPRLSYETWIVPKQHRSHFENTAPEAVQSLAVALKLLLQKIDRGLNYPAYNYVLHQGAAADHELPHFHWHLEVVPRVARIAGFEWGTNYFVNHTTPEQAAEFLRGITVET